MQNSKIIYVYFNDCDRDILMGRLYIDNLRGKEIHSFEYDDKWLDDKKNNIFIDPEIKFYSGRQWKVNNLVNSMFGIFLDSAPDRWGRLLLKRKEYDAAKAENRNVRTLLDSDYLLGVSDFLRMGAIRFKRDVDGDFVENIGASIPPIARLRELEQASMAFENDEMKNELEILLDPGSSLGGARPKANVVDEKGNVYIAKFPSKNDEYDVGALEKKVYDLAKLCGLNVVDSAIHSFSKKGSTFIIKRFDRNIVDGKILRTHFESAMALLGKLDGDDTTSYLDIVSFIRSYGMNIKEDLLELYKRIAFNILVKNTDDHLRNHGFLLKDGKWVLSPLYDVNYNKNGKYLHLLIDEKNSELNLDILVDTAKCYEITKDEGNKIVRDMQEKIPPFLLAS